MPWGKVKVEAIVADDEAKQDVGVRRYRYMVSEGVKGVGGQTWAPLAFAINAIVSKEPMPYFPISVIPKEGFMKGKLAPHLRRAEHPLVDRLHGRCRRDQDAGQKEDLLSGAAPTAGAGTSGTACTPRPRSMAARSSVMKRSRWDQRLHDDPAKGQGSQTGHLHLRSVRRRRHRAPEAVPPDGPQQR